MGRKIVAGNWKMNTMPEEGAALASAIVSASAELSNDVELIVAPPLTHLYQVSESIRGSRIRLAAQNCADKASGAYTGEVSAAMIRALGCDYVILGHSERRQYYGENSETLNRKMQLAFENGLSPIYCVGEKLEEREAGRHFDVVGKQLEEVLFTLDSDKMSRTVVAYEPVWAIGTGKTATADQAQEIHSFIRKRLAERFGQEIADSVTILYGGSCKPSNARELFACRDIDGGLIGGASLKAPDFIGIASSY